MHPIRIPRLASRLRLTGRPRLASRLRLPLTLAAAAVLTGCSGQAAANSS